jgi:predicted nucleic acid-binding protein
LDTSSVYLTTLIKVSVLIKPQQFDTDVVLDLLLDRQPFSTPAADLFSRVERAEIRGYLCATTVTTVHYLAAKVIGTRRARAEV